MIKLTHEGAPTCLVDVGGLAVASQRFGPLRGAPLLTLNLFDVRMNNRNPATTNVVAAKSRAVSLKGDPVHELVEA